MIITQGFQKRIQYFIISSAMLFERICSKIRYYENWRLERVRDLRNWGCRISRCSREPWLPASRRASDAAVAAAVFARRRRPLATRLGVAPPSLSSPLPRSSPWKPSKINYLCPVVLGYYSISSFSGMARGRHVVAMLLVERSPRNLC